MTDETRRILDLLAQQKITVDEADQLLQAAKAERSAPEPAAPADEQPPRARYLRVEIHRAADQWRRERQVNIRVPLSMVRGGMKLGALIPGTGDRIAEHLRARGLDLDWSRLDQAQLDAVLKDLGELTLDVDDGRAQVRITAE
jgi:hypothetical protein